MNDPSLQWSPVEHDPFAGPELEAFAPVTQSQSELWLSSALETSANLAYNEGLGLRLQGLLDAQALSSALQTVVDRHESLRALFSADGRWMCVRRALALDLQTQVLQGEPDPAAALEAAVAQQMRQPFDLEQGPLLRCTLYRMAPQEHHLLLVAHHIVCDGWSMAQLLTEIGALYSAAVEQREAALPAPDRYTEYAALEEEFLQSAEGAEQLAWWLERLRDAPPPVELPADRARQAQRSFEAGRCDHRLPEPLVAALRKLSAEQGSSLVMTLLAGLAAQLQRLGAGEDLVIGLAAAGQALYERPRLVGHCVNFLPLRLRPQGGGSAAEFLRQVRAEVLDAFEHQGISLGALLPRLALTRDEARPPLVSVVFNLDQRDDDIAHSGLQVDYRTLPRACDAFELYLNVVDNGRDLLIEASYNRALFDQDTILRRLREFETLLQALPGSLDRPLAELPLLQPGERDRLAQLSDGGTAARPALALHELVARQAAQRPQAIAVEGGGRSLSYGGLMARSGDIAAALVAAGVKPGDIVGVCLRRGADLPAALLGVLRSGAAWLPMDPELPAARLEFMLGDAGAGLLLCERATAALLPQVQQLLLEDIGAGEPPAIAVDPEAAAYVIYTSGSTGTPKGVVAQHRGIVNCLLGTAEWIPLAEQDALLAIATFAFDASVLEVFLPLACGSRLVIATEDQAADGRLMAAAIGQHDITRIFTAPAAWRLLLDAGWEGSPQMVGISWAEPLGAELAQALRPRLRELWNLYGPTEATVWTLGKRIDDPAAPITIGRPIPNTRVLLLDAAGEPVPQGVAGELCIAGDGVSLGYLDRAELQAARFVEAPGGGRLYRSGDLARLDAAGDIVCLGRADHQVKLRGFRIELGEIESALCALDEVAEAVCGLRERAPGDARLVAWVQAAPAAAVTAGELRRQLRERLPSYMVPQNFLLLETLPRLSNGKLDRGRLPDPFAAAAEAAAPAERQAPRDETERRLAAIWAGILGHEAFGIGDHFLDVGGHSLLAAQLANRIRAEFGLRLPLRTVMTGSLAQLAEACRPTEPAPAAAARRGRRKAR